MSMNNQNFWATLLSFGLLLFLVLGYWAYGWLFVSGALCMHLYFGLFWRVKFGHWPEARSIDPTEEALVLYDQSEPQSPHPHREASVALEIDETAP